MRNTIEVELEISHNKKQIVTIKELTVKEIIELGNKVIQEKKPDDLTLDSIKKALDKNLSYAVEGITMEEILELAPSDIKMLFDKFQEVNSSFLAIAEEMGIINLLNNIKDDIKQNYLRLSADLLSQDIKTA